MIESLEACTLPVSDLDRSLQFYRDVGFEVVENAAGRAILRVGDNELVLLSPAAAEAEPKFAGARVGGAMALHFRVADPDRLWDLVGRGAVPVLEPLGDRAYQDRDFTIQDPDGYRLVFGRALE